MSDLLRKLELEAAYDNIELEALIAIDELKKRIKQVDSTHFETRAEHLKAIKPFQEQLKPFVAKIDEVNEKRLMVGFKPSYAYVYASTLPSPPQSISQLMMPLSPSLFLMPLSLPIDNGPVHVTEPIELSFEEKEKEKDDDDDVAPKKLKRKRKQELESEDESEESSEYESSAASDSEECDDDGIVDDDQRIKVYAPTEDDASEQEVMNFDARTLGKCDENGVYKELQTRKDSKYKLRNVKPKIHDVEKMLEAALKGDLSHIKRWFEAEVFQNKNLMVFGSNQTDHTNDAYQELLDLARNGKLDPLKSTLATRKARCQLCQTVKPTSHGLQGKKQIFRVGTDCWKKFNLVFDSMDFIKWLSTKGGTDQDLKEAIKKFQKIEEDRESFFN